MGNQGTSRACVFCGSTDQLEREHIWPEWVQKALSPSGKVGHVHTQGTGAGESVRSYNKLPFRLRLRIVCKPCNSRWMSQIETRAKQWALPIILGRGKALHETGQHDLATWAVLKTLVSAHASAAFKDDPIVPDSNYSDMYALRHEPRPLDQSMVWIGTYGGERYNANAGLRGLHLTLPNDERTKVEGYLATYSIKRLVLVVFGHASPETIGIDLAANVAPAFQQIWPFERSLTGGIAPTLSDDGLMSLVKDVPVE